MKYRVPNRSRTVFLDTLSVHSHRNLERRQPRQGVWSRPVERSSDSESRLATTFRTGAVHSDRR
jgi:hypothetical protein